MRARIPVLLLIVILTISGCGTRNQSPTLLRFTASSERLYVGDVVELKVEAVDPENQPLSFSWSTDDGSFVQVKGNEAVWTSLVAGNHTVYVEVEDPFGGVARGSLRLEVLDRVALPAGMQVVTKLLRDVYGEAVRIGDLVPLRVVEAVSVDGFEVISEGADAIGQVLYVQPGVNGSAGFVVLAPTQVQLANGQQIALDPLRPGGGSTAAGHAVLGLAGTEFAFAPDDPPIVRAGAILYGVTQETTYLRVRPGRVLDGPEARESLVGIQACLGIHVVDFSELVLSLFADGVRIEGFQTDGAAARSGLLVGDRVYGVRIGSEEYPIASTADLRRVERLLQPGDEVTLLVRNLLRRAEIPLQVDACYTVLPSANGSAR